MDFLEQFLTRNKADLNYSRDPRENVIRFSLGCLISKKFGRKKIWAFNDLVGLTLRGTSLAQITTLFIYLNFMNNTKSEMLTFANHI